MSSLNKHMIIGYLGVDPEFVGTEGKICRFAVGTNENWTDKTTGEKKQRVTWHRIVIFNDHFVQIAKEHLHKGSQVYIEGSSITREYTDKDNIKRWSTELVVGAYNGQLKILGKRETDNATRDSGEAAPQDAPKSAGWDMIDGNDEMFS